MKKSLKEFKQKIYRYYQEYGRVFPWRETQDAYSILVSEIMLQQTQTDRVLPKYNSFIKIFPDFKTLANASLGSVLIEWQGLGYNRRAIHLKNTMEIIAHHYKGILPDEEDELIRLPGIGPYTARALQTFVFNKPTVFIETNIRTVFIHSFFKDKENIRDKDIMPLIDKTLDKDNPRHWYYALMDYGVMLKKKYGNANRKSKHYTKQSRFKGSNRELRSMILKKILSNQGISQEEIIRSLNQNSVSIDKNIRALLKEGFIKMRNNSLEIDT